MPEQLARAELETYFDGYDSRSDEEQDETCKHALEGSLSLDPTPICMDIGQSLGFSEDRIVTCDNGFAAFLLEPISYPCHLASIKTHSNTRF